MSQLHLICFDIADEKHLRKVAIQMENHGQRVQYSVFECHLTDAQLEQLKHNLATIIDPEQDHIRYYPLCPKDHPNIQIDGPGEITPNPDYYLL